MSSNITPNQVLANRYQLKHRIGRGGFSVVWMAADLECNNAQVAIKIFAPDKGLDGADIDQFRREKIKSDRLQHPRLLKVLDYFVHGDSPCLVLVYMPNGSLFQRIKDQPTGRPEAQIARVLYQVSDGLDYLHQARIAHLDVKPDNILFDAFNDCVLSDFGISSDLRTTLLHASQLQGETMGYVSPERVLGERQLTEQVDIFALGVTLYEMCIGLIPHGHIIGHTVAFDRPKPALPAEYSKRFQQLIHACWNNRPADRPTAAQLKAYAHHFLERGAWPPIVEYRPEVAPDPVAYNAAGASVLSTEDAGSGRRTEMRGPAAGSAPQSDPAPILEKERKGRKRRALIFWWSVAASLLLGGGGFYWGYGQYRVGSDLAFAQRAFSEDRLSIAYDFCQKVLAARPGYDETLRLQAEISQRARATFRNNLEAADAEFRNGHTAAARIALSKARTDARIMGDPTNTDLISMTARINQEERIARAPEKKYLPAPDVPRYLPDLPDLPDNTPPSERTVVQLPAQTEQRIEKIAKPRAPADPLENFLAAGIYTGTITDRIPGQAAATYQATFRPVVASRMIVGNYPTFPCVSDWNYLRTEKKGSNYLFFFRERITAGKNNCEDNLTIQITYDMNRPGQAAVTYLHAKEGIVGTGRLYVSH